jgi:hypothetical protein
MMSQLIGLGEKRPMFSAYTMCKYMRSIWRLAFTWALTCGVGPKWRLVLPPIIISYLWVCNVYQWSRGPMYFVFCRLYHFSPQPATIHSSHLFLTYCVAGAGLPCLIIRCESFRGTQKEDDRGPLSIHPHC